MTDRRAYDPYAPFTAPAASPKPLAADPGPVPTSPQGQQGDAEKARDAAEQIPSDLDEITLKDLKVLADLADVASYGTKAELAQRIREAASR